MQIALTPKHTVTVTPVYDTYWRFAAKRQELFHRRVQGLPAPWTDDRIIAQNRFTNAYRASDRVSQYLIRHISNGGPSAYYKDLAFRTLLFKIFNRIETWEGLVEKVGEPLWKNFDYEAYAKALDDLMAKGSIYSAAYIMPSPPFGEARKHRNHLKLIQTMMQEDFADRVTECKSLEEVFTLIKSYPSMGNFLAFQLAIDLNYSYITGEKGFSEMDFVVAGPGAKNGIKKCFADTAGLSEADIIRAMAERAPLEFERLGLTFYDLWGRPLQLIDCQNLFCETDKYARVAHPEFNQDRTKIKQRFSPNKEASDPQWYPFKWKLKPEPLDLPPLVSNTHSLADFGL